MSVNRDIKVKKPSGSLSLSVFSVKRNIVFFAFLLCIICAGCGAKLEKTSSTRFMMDTFVQIDLWGKDPVKDQESMGKCLDVMQDAADRSDMYSETSECSLVSHNAGVKPVKVSDDVFAMVDFVLQSEYKQVDITLGPVTKLWKTAREEKLIPDEKAMKEALLLVGKDKIATDKNNSTIYLKEKGMVLDLGAVAKGWAVEKAARYLAGEKNISCALINGGGNIKVLGTKPDKKLWRIAVQDPAKEEDVIGILSLQGGEAVATSGNYQRYAEIDGKRYHHLLSPVTGYPVNENISVTVVCEDAFLADYYSTLLFLMPAKDAIIIAGKSPLKGVVIIDAGGEVHISDGLKGRFERNEKSKWFHK